jgi:O-antigen/teichoic acid export membrane protein
MGLVNKLRGLVADPMLRNMVINGAAALIIKVLAAGLSFAMFVLIANALSVAEFGKFAFGFSLAITLSTIAGLGLNTAVLRFLPQYDAQKVPEKARGFMIAAGLASVLVPLLFALGLALAAYVLHISRPQLDPAYLYATAIFIPILAIMEYLANVLRASGYTVAAMAPRDVIWRALVCGAAVLVVILGYRYNAVAFLILSSVTLTLVFLGQVFWGRKALRPLTGTMQPGYDFPLWIKTALPMWGAASVFALVQQFDVVILGLFMSPEQAGPYFAALRTAGMLSLLLIAGNLISAPLIARYHHAGDQAALQKIVRLLTMGIALPTLAGFLILVVIGGWLLSWFDMAFVAAYPLLVILGIGFTVDAMAGPTGYMLQMVGKELTYLKIMGSAYAFTLVLQCLLIPLLGPYGAAIPNALGLILANFLLVRTIRRDLGIDPSVFGLFHRSSPVD